jgi:hypothetical protein
MGIRSLIVACLCCFPLRRQTSDTAKTYVEEAYKLYSLLLPQQESYRFAKGTLIIQEDTVTNEAASHPCLTPEAASRFKDAITDYMSRNRQPRLLKRQFQINKAYELVSSDTIEALFNQGSWDSFFLRYPDSAGYITISAVGFNKDKTRAVLYMGNSCGGLCGSWGFHLLEKTDGKWKSSPGVTCFTAS